MPRLENAHPLTHTQKINFAYHGNFCGPGWNNGKYQSSQLATIEPLDEFDATCAEHDNSYYKGDYYNADIKFARENFTTHPKRLLSSLAIGAQALARKTGLMPRRKKATTRPRRPRGKRVARRLPARKRPMRRKMRGPTRRPTLRSAPVALGLLEKSSPAMTQKSTTMTLRGRDFIATVGGVAAAQGDVLASIDLSPLSADFPRLNYFAAAFEQYTVGQIKVTYAPSCAATTNGQLVLYVDPDPDDETPIGVPAINTAMAAQGSRVTNVWAPAQIEFKPAGKRTYFTSPSTDKRFSSPGRVNIIAMTSIGATTLGTLYIDYVFHLKKPMLETPASTLSNSGVLIKYTGSSAFNASYPYQFETAPTTMVGATSSFNVNWVYLLGQLKLPPNRAMLFIANYLGNALEGEPFTALAATAHNCVLSWFGTPTADSEVRNHWTGVAYIETAGSGADPPYLEMDSGSSFSMVGSASAVRWWIIPVDTGFSLDEPPTEGQRIAKIEALLASLGLEDAMKQLEKQNPTKIEKPNKPKTLQTTLQLPDEVEVQTEPAARVATARMTRKPTGGA